jgi:uncharacterized protein (DUF2267 family)
MQYQKFIAEMLEFEFVWSRSLADGMVKAVLGILASRVDEAAARKMTAKLPEPLTFERLRGHQQRQISITFEECKTEIADQFQLNREQADLLIHRVLHLARETTGAALFAEIEERLPADWVVAMEEA